MKATQYRIDGVIWDHVSDSLLGSMFRRQVSQDGEPVRHASLLLVGGIAKYHEVKPVQRDTE